MVSFGQYPDMFYRVTVKAVIKDNRGLILAAWDNDGFWNLPGGGIDHGETPRTALARELQEELGYTGEFTMEYKDTLTYFSQRLNYCLMHQIFNVTLADYSGSTGEDAERCEFIDPSKLDLTPIAHQFIYKYGYDVAYEIPFAN